MTTLIVRLSTNEDVKVRFVAVEKLALASQAVEATPSVEFATYDDMHRILAPPRLAIVKALAGQGTLSIREIARRVERDVRAVHRDVTRLVHAGVIDRHENGVEFPYDNIHFEFDVRSERAA
jgi:predicted transcriptional regulator